MNVIKLEPWRENVHTKYGYVSEVPVNWLFQYKGNERRLTNEQFTALSQSIKEEGLREPVTIIVGLKDHYVYLGEGNHRLDVYHESGYETIPARVWVYQFGKKESLGIPSKHCNEVILPTDDPFYYSLSCSPEKAFSSYKIHV